MNIQVKIVITILIGVFVITGCKQGDMGADGADGADGKVYISLSSNSDALYVDATELGISSFDFFDTYYEAKKSGKFYWYDDSETWWYSIYLHDPLPGEPGEVGKPGEEGSYCITIITRCAGADGADGADGKDTYYDIFVWNGVFSYDLWTFKAAGSQRKLRKSIKNIAATRVMDLTKRDYLTAKFVEKKYIKPAGY